MIGIESIASYIPPGRESNAALLSKFGVDQAFLITKIGVLEKARKQSDDDTSDLCCRAFEALAAKTAVRAEEIDCLIVCTQNPDGHGLPHTSAIVQGKLGCTDRVAAFDIALGCSGYVYALAVITAFMAANDLHKGLLFTADPYSKIVDPDDKNTALLFGDAATVTFISNTPIFSIQRAQFGTRGREGAALVRTGERLSMNGRAVFDFSMTAVPPQVEQLLAQTGYTVDDLDLILLHQGSKFIVDQLTRRLKLPTQKVPSNLAQVGNTVSSSIPLLLEQHIDEPATRIVLISGFGVGLSWASAILVRNGMAPDAPDL
jgi:3-oxoacyl-[acyl-carrier-protein] synthase III